MRKNTKKLEEAKQWYLDAVESNLILRGMPKKKAQVLIKKYKLKKMLNLFPEIQMHYRVEDTADEIVAG